MSNYMKENIKKIMSSQSINQHELAQELGLSRSYITMLINGDRALNGQILIDFSKALGVSAKELLLDPNAKTEEYAIFQRGQFETRAARLELKKIMIEMDNYVLLKEQLDNAQQ